MKVIVLFFMLLIILPDTYSQKLKLRLEPGISLPVTTYNQEPFWSPFSTKPIPNNYFTFEKTWKSPDFFYMHASYWLLFGYETQKGVQYELGYHPSEGLQYYLLWRWYNYGWTDPLTGTDILQETGYSIGFHIPGNKVRGLVAIPMNKEKNSGLLLSVVLGGTWSHFGKEQKYSSSTEGYFPESLYPDTAIILGFCHWIHKHNTCLLLGGVQLSYNTKKRELLSLRLIYEQGLFVVGQVDYYVTRNKTMIAGSVASRGSAIHLKLSIPIDLYSFNKPDSE